MLSRIGYEGGDELDLSLRCKRVKICDLEYECSGN